MQKLGHSGTPETGMGLAGELRELASNLLWIWHPDTISVVRDIDPALWRKVNHNPVAFLHRIPRNQLEERASELALEPRISFAFHRLHEYLNRERRAWGDIYAGPLRSKPVAYFCAEFGLHESIPIYSGGLGTLSGDMLKSASDLGIPLVGVGLFYAQGYFNQRLDAAGWQQESYSEAEIEYLPLELVLGPAGKPILVYVETRTSRIAIRLWKARVGRVDLFLLDSDVEQNSAADRGLTGRLYGGDSKLRISQELILGVGGLRALQAMGITPSVLHLNEGHSAFAILEQARNEMNSDGISFQDAVRRASLQTVFTTHTPIPAGHDRFDTSLMEHAIGPLRDQLGISQDSLMALGRVNGADSNEPFCMTVLGLRVASRSNAVSSLHGHVTRKMWNTLWPGRAETDVPIDHITNGVHISSWLAPPMAQLYDRYLGPNWRDATCLPQTWLGIDSVEDAELWEVHQTIKTRLISYVQRQMIVQEGFRAKDKSPGEPTACHLAPSVLTIGFARRFATYKRSDLLISDPARLERLLLNPTMPVQVVFAGKAHPKDDAGKQLIQRIFKMSRDRRFLGRVVFVEDYDINVARHLVQGVDVWVNAPRKPLEAS
ncbi:MAG: alpha-glucan family phosphorylase, partial [bacterium]